MLLKIAFALICGCSGVFISDQAPIQPIQSLATLPGTTDEVTRIYFMRNAESDYSATDATGMKFTSGKSPQVPLTERGIEQARHLHEALASKAQDIVIFTPPAMRAEQTASYLLSPENRIALGGTSEGLLEVGMGVWEGKPKDQLYKNEYQKRKNLSASIKYVTPKVATGESYDAAASRGFVALHGILEKEQGKTLFIISGENLLNAMAMRWTHPQLSDEPGSDLPLLPLDYCDLFMVEIPRGQSIETANLIMIIQVNS